MTLVLFWRNEQNLVVIADTLFRAGGQNGVQVGPKIFASTVRARSFDDHNLRVFPDVGFAFAGHTAAGQITQALAGGALQNLIAPSGTASPTLLEIADYYSRCASYVVNEMRAIFASDRYLFEGLVFGLDEGQPAAYSLELFIDDEGDARCTATKVDFERSPLQAIGQGADVVENFLEKTYALGKPPSPYDALRTVIEDPSVPEVGGAVQGALVGPRGVELKAVLTVGADGQAFGGFMGADLGQLGTLGSFGTPNLEPVVLRGHSSDTSPHET